MKRLIGYLFLTAILVLGMFTGCTTKPENNNPTGGALTSGSAMRSNNAALNRSTTNYNNGINRAYDNNSIYDSYVRNGYNNTGTNSLNNYGTTNYGTNSTNRYSTNNNATINRTTTNSGINTRSNVNNNTIGTPYTTIR